MQESRTRHVTGLVPPEALARAKWTGQIQQQKLIKPTGDHSPTSRVLACSAKDEEHIYLVIHMVAHGNYALPSLSAAHLSLTQ